MNNYIWIREYSDTKDSLDRLVKRLLNNEFVEDPVVSAPDVGFAVTDIAGFFDSIRLDSELNFIEYTVQLAC